MRPEILYRVQIWTLTRPKHEPGSQATFWLPLRCGQEHCLVKKTICSSLGNNCSIVGSFCNILPCSKSLTDFLQWSISPVSAAEKAPHIFIRPCIHDAFIVVFLNISSKTLLWNLTMKPKTSFYATCTLWVKGGPALHESLSCAWCFFAFEAHHCNCMENSSQYILQNVSYSFLQ